MINQRHLSARQLVAYFLLWDRSQVAARPNPQEPSASATEAVVPVTLTGTSDGQPVTATYTPTSFSVTGLAPPITAATTVTTTDDKGATIAVAVAAGAGIVAGGALAAWLFEPVPGAPPAPTEPPSYSTVDQNDDPEPTEDPNDPETTTTSDSPACPFPTQGSQVEFEDTEQQPEWTAEIPSQTTSSFYADCTPSGDNGQLFRGLDPGFITELSAVFCKGDLSSDVSKEIGKDDLPDDSSWKRDDGPEENVEFTFDLKNNAEGCDSHCEKAYSDLISSCKCL